MTPDVNVMVAASRSDHSHHAVARAWLERAVTASSAGAAFTLMPMVLAGFLRLVTSPKIFQRATPIEDAVAFVDALLASPGVQLAPLGQEWPKFRQLYPNKQPGGNDLPHAWLSAAVVRLGEHLVSFDRDYRKLLAHSQFTLLTPAQCPEDGPRFNPLAQPDADLFKSLMDGEQCLRSCADDPKKASAKVGCCFRLLHAHGLIAKIPRTRRW